MEQFVDTLKALLKQYGLPVDEDAVDRLAVHHTLLVQWNRQTNLTADTSPSALCEAHYIDSLMGLRVVQAVPTLDIGSGAGFPGLVLAAALPEVPFVLLEPRRKRASFLSAAAVQMGLSCVSVVNSRLEAAYAGAPLAQAVTRATFSPKAYADLMFHVEHWVNPGARMFCWASADAGPGPMFHVEHFEYELRGKPRRILELSRQSA